MATVLKIPLDAGIADQQMDITLDKKPLTLRVTWNEYGQYWYFSLSERNGESIIDGIKMVKDTFLLKRYQLSSPEGDFIFMDNYSGKERPDFYSLGNDHLLLYRTKY
ncbi:phage baseplate plug family protein [Pragia fontium]|uniref:Cyanophage baseplate Pam3 plug gp18 domain-containing protein n=1 Tax=Pragia fontium DSM 5563 = ATCC 49100 TaxID=1122977 RepID=A0AAJ4W7F0_9GAMM|nr:hypothetical protein [Pragia fontium]SFB97247.1 hypothetical protein SAMN02745723_10164 [Pragia fontium DSM 5563 = ATCC 49100]SUB81746.1 Uncharacterised protein [Pragia fontium]VEJ54287.1 Uncharacterised protein [Pragia fontium]